MPSHARSVVDVVEVAYRAASRGPATWIEAVLAMAEPLLDLGLGVVAYEYDTTRPREAWLSQPVGDPFLTGHVLKSYAATPPAINDWVHRRAGALTVLSDMLRMSASEHAAIAPQADAFAMKDMFGVNASDPSGRGTYFCAPSPHMLRRSDPRLARWERVSAHVAAAGRLRGALASVPEAILAPDGRVLHALAPAQESLDALRRGALAMDRARTRARRTEPEALASWRALVEGRWSFVDEIEHDGRRILLAHANAPSAPDPRRLTAMERLVAGFVAMGHANKLIAYELGLVAGTVAFHVHAIAKKLGVRTRVEVVDRLMLLTSGETRDLAIDGEVLTAIVADQAPAPEVRLTRAEQAVAQLAARGRSSAYIAEQRGVSKRTVANQLANIFAKLGVGSRSELARCLARLPAT